MDIDKKDKKERDGSKEVYEEDKLALLLKDKKLIE